MKKSFLKTGTSAAFAYLVPVLICTVCMFLFCFDRKLLFFESGPALWLYRALLLLGCLYAGLLGLLLRTEKQPMPLSTSALTRLLSGICGIFLFSTVLMQGICTALSIDCEKYSIVSSPLGVLLGLGVKTEIIGTVQLIALVLAIPAGLYFLLSALRRNINKAPRILLGCTAVLWSLAQSVLANFYVSAFPMNSPLRLIPMVAGVFRALYLLAEVRCITGRGKYSLFIASGFLAVGSLMIHVLSEGILTILGVQQVGLSTVYAVLSFFLALYICERMLATCRVCRTNANA